MVLACESVAAEALDAAIIQGHYDSHFSDPLQPCASSVTLMCAVA